MVSIEINSNSLLNGFHGTRALLTLVDDPSHTIQLYALKKLLNCVERQWYEIVDYLPRLEQIRSDPSFPDKCLIALLMSMIYYYLDRHEQSIHYALESGTRFDITSQSDYVQSVLSFCISKYINIRSNNYQIEQSNNSIENASSQNENADVAMEVDEEELQKLECDSRLEAIIDRLIQKCIDDRKYKQAIGLCLESRRIDKLQFVIECSNDQKEHLLNYLIECVFKLLTNDSLCWQKDVLDLAISIYVSNSTFDFFQILKGLIQLNKPKALGILILKTCESNFSLALQMVFDMFESCSQNFRLQVINHVQAELNQAVEKYRESDEAKDQTQENVEIDYDAEEFIEDWIRSKADISKLMKLISVMSGNFQVHTYMQFLIRHNHADLSLLKYIKEHTRNMLCHSAVIIANGFMHCGTTCDQFLRDHLEWLSSATNWARFTATASLGVIHRFHEKEALRLMDAYLPKSSTNTLSPYAEGGGLYALGLIYANHGPSKIIKYIEDSISQSNNPVVRHGGCLGLGLLTLGSHNQNVLEIMKDLLSTNDAVIGEATTISIGMTMMGSYCRDLLSQLIYLVEETQHEKISRGASIGIALICYNIRENAWPTIRTLCESQFIYLRRAGMYAIGMAWIGTGLDEAVRKLLHFAVSDVSDDVRRAAVESLGFVLLQQSHDKIISIISLLNENYNPHVRYGSCIALGIAFAGTGNSEALTLLEPLAQDSTAFVRLSACIAQVMIVANISEVQCPQAKTIRSSLSKMVSDKHEDLMAKYGAIIAQGILDACGRNATISIQCRSTDLICCQSAAGVLMFLHFWFWFPLTHMLCLAFQPSAVICVTDTLQIPEMEIWTTSPGSYFAYPPSLAEQRRGVDKGDKVEAAVLSIRQRARQSRSGRSKVSKDISKAKAAEKTLPIEEKQPETDQAEKSQTAESSEQQIKSSDKKSPKSELSKSTKSLLFKNKQSKSAISKPAIAKPSKPTEDEIASPESPPLADRGILLQKKMTDSPSKVLKLRNMAAVRRHQAHSIFFPSNGRFKSIFLLLNDGIVGEQRSKRTGFTVVVDQKPEAGPYKMMRVLKSSALPKDEPVEPNAPEPFEYAEEDPNKTTDSEKADETKST